MSDEWAWEREKFVEMRANGKRDPYEIVAFNSIRRLGADSWIRES